MIKQWIKEKILKLFDARVIPFYVMCGGSHVWRYTSPDMDKSDKENKFCLIQKDHINAGIMEDYINFLLVIDFSLCRGWIPVIDRITYPARFQQEEADWGKKNSWEIYFEQPFAEYDVDYVKKNAANVIEATPFISFDILEVQSCDGVRFMRMFLSEKEEHILYANHLKTVAKEYIRFNSNTLKTIVEKAEKAFKKKNGKVLAVSVREEMFLRSEPTGVKLDNLFLYVEEQMKKWGCSQIFIASEFESRIELCYEYFGEDKVLHLDRKRPYSGEDEKEKEILRLSENYTEDNCRRIFELQEEVFGPKYERWLNYLAEMYCVSCCDSAILQASSGNTGVLLMKEGKFENVIMLNDIEEFQEL